MNKNSERLENVKISDLLKIISIAGILTIGIVAPGVPAAIFRLNKRWFKYKPNRFRQALKRMERTNLVSVKEVDGKVQLRLTKKGKERLLRYNVDEIEIKRPARWDRKWRLVIFDIPDSRKIAREILRDKLKKLGFYPLQESVFLHPFKCEEEIEFLRNLLEVQNNVQIHTVSKLENEDFYRQFFELSSE